MPTDRARDVRRVLLIEGLANVVAVSTKLGVGFATGSLALLSDALHSGADLANNVLAWITIRIAESPPDDDHPYGHAKFETLAVFVLGTLMGVLGLEIFLGVFRRSSEAVITTSPVALAVIGGTLLLQLSVAAWQARRARQLKSELLRADAAHTLVDSLTTLVALAGWQLGARGLGWLDGALAIVVAILVIALAYQLFKRAIPILVDGAAVHPDELRAAVGAVPGVLRVDRARSRWYGQQRAADVTICVDPALDATEAHEIADAVEHRLAEQLEISDAVVHVEPLRH